VNDTPKRTVPEASSPAPSLGIVALRLAPTLVFYAFICQLQTAVITVLMFLLSTSVGQVFQVGLSVVVVWLSRHGRARLRWPSTQRGVEGVSLALVAAVIAVLVVSGRATEVGSFILSIGAVQIAAWLVDSRSRIAGKRETRPGLETAGWIVGAWALAYVISIQVVVLVGVLQLIRNGALLSRLLRRGGLVGWQVALAFGVLGLLGAQIAHTVQSMPSSCEPALRDESELRVEDNDRMLTIATIGDSSTYGIFLPARLSYPGRLQARLRAARPDLNVRVINCSFSGATSDHGALQLDDALRYKPAVVTIALGDNDDLGDNDAWAGTDQRAAPEAVSRHLARNLADLVARCRSANVVPVLLTAPAGTMGGQRGMQWVHAPTRQVAAQERAELVDADLAVRAKPFPPMHFIADFGHPNQFGHDLIAQQIADRLLPRLDTMVPSVRSSPSVDGESHLSVQAP